MRATDVAKLSRSEQIIAEKTVCILMVRGEDPQSKKIYAYVGIRADKLEDFMEAQRKGLFYPEDYGVVLASGEGEPDEETRERMTREYGFNHQAMIDIPDATKAHDIASNISAHKTEAQE
jgi:hypothetical protein